MRSDSVNSSGAENSGSRAAILGAAQRLFARRGFDGTAMADIVSESGLSTGTVYHYFGNKEALVTAVSRSLSGVDFSASSGRDLTPERAVDMLLTAAEDDRLGRLALQTWAKSVDSPTLRDLFVERHELGCRWLAQSIDGSDEPSDTALGRAELVICAIGGYQQRHATEIPLHDLDGFRAELHALVAGGAAPS